MLKWKKKHKIQYTLQLRKYRQIPKKQTEIQRYFKCPLPHIYCTVSSSYSGFSLYEIFAFSTDFTSSCRFRRGILMKHNSKGIIHLVRTQNFPKHKHFFTPNTHTCVCVSGSKKWVNLNEDKNTLLFQNVFQKNRTLVVDCFPFLHSVYEFCSLLGGLPPTPPLTEGATGYLL